MKLKYRRYNRLHAGEFYDFAHTDNVEYTEEEIEEA